MNSACANRPPALAEAIEARSRRHADVVAAGHEGMRRRIPNNQL